MVVCVARFVRGGHGRSTAHIRSWLIVARHARLPVLACACLPAYHYLPVCLPVKVTKPETDVSNSYSYNTHSPHDFSTLHKLRSSIRFLFASAQHPRPCCFRSGTSSSPAPAHPAPANQQHCHSEAPVGMSPATLEPPHHFHLPCPNNKTFPLCHPTHLSTLPPLTFLQ